MTCVHGKKCIPDSEPHTNVLNNNGGYTVTSRHILYVKPLLYMGGGGGGGGGGWWNL